MPGQHKLNLAFVEEHIAYVGVGSNLGDKRALCLKAIEILNEMAGITVERRSSFYRSAPLGPPDQDWFVNAVLRLKTNLEPRALLAALHLTELQLGRQRSIHWGPRTIDLDLLFYDDLVLQKTDLVLPHPQAHQRHFVLLPLCEIAPRLLHPQIQRTVTQILRGLSPQTTCTPLNLAENPGPSFLPAHAKPFFI